MIFKSSEIRWFSTQKDVLWELYENLPEVGDGVREPDRTDYYLKSGTANTGIKIREGNHELKLKSADDEELDFGVMEHWIKWSMPEEKNILNSIDGDLLVDWIAVKKQRYQKRYEIFDQEKAEIIDKEFVDEGCGAEFTNIIFPSSGKTLFTFGLEAFSSSGRQRENLVLCLKELDIKSSRLSKLDSCGYPQMLKSL